MPRTLRPRLKRMLERANPHVATFVELSVPDTGKILRRATDQFLQSPDPLVSMSPAVSAQASPAGALTLASVSQTLISQFADSGTYFYLPQEQGSGKFHGTVGWTLDPAFPGGLLRGVTVKLRWITPSPPDAALQIYKVHRSAGVIRRQQGTSTVETFAVQHSFAPLLAEPVVRRFKDIGVILSDVDVAFDLTPYHLAIDPISSPPPGPQQSGDLPEYFIEISPVLQPTGNFVGWVRDTTSSRVIAGIGTVREVGWQRGNPDDPASLWTRTDHNDRSLCLTLDVEQYAATSQAVYALNLPATPSADSTGRVVFRHGEPSGTSAALELSTAGSSGPWTPVADGDVVSVKQATYHARLTMTASSDQRRAPVVSAIGVEFRGTTDLSAESTLEPMTQGVAIPFCAASVGEGTVRVVRAGRRDYRDLAGASASVGPDTQLEVDAFLGSRHPTVTRADWFHTTRAQVSTRQPSGTSEVFTLLSIAKTLKRKIPARIESISTVHTVVAATTTQVQVSPVLTGASATGNEYDGKGYYLRVRTSSQPGVETGSVFTIDGNTGVDKLDFPSNADPTLSHELPGTFAVGDAVEVHSARYAQPALQWVNQDPADIWWELLTLHLGVPADRIGLADVGGKGRAGLPPTVTDRAPGDSATQALLKVTLKITDAEDGDALIDQLSFLMGGATVEIAGQLVFRQIYALKDAAGRITVAPDAPALTFDARDLAALDTPTGREQRITVCACDYGVDTTSAAALPTATTNFVDVDALDAYELQDVEGLGTDQVPSEIARWCYNSTDLGQFLATQLAHQVVSSCSTGVRLWPFTTVDAHPELTVGDTVVVITDQYTDYDPARGIPVTGVMAYPLVLVSTAAGGRRFVGFLQGLGSVVSVDVRGGDGTLQDNNPTPVGVGPSLDVSITHDDVSASIAYTAADGTLSLYIDGAGPSAVPASPIIVARPGPRSKPIEYKIVNAGTSGQDVSESVVVLPRPVSTGAQILSNPSFGNGLTGYSVYDNFASGHVHIAAIVDSTAPNASGRFMRVTVDGSTTPGVTTEPGFGGFFRAIGPDSGVAALDTYHRGAKLTWTVRAKVPVGYTISWAANAFGTGSTVTPLTPMVGTGDWFDYQWLTQVGTSGTFSTIGFFYLSGPGAGGFTWDVALCSSTDANQPALNNVSPDLQLTPGTETATTKAYTVTATNPIGGATPAILITLNGTTGTGSVSGAFADGIAKAAVSGEVITVNRPAFGTTVQASLTAVAILPDAAPNTIQRTIANQVKTTFGPSLSAQVTYSGSNASIAYTGSGGTVEVSINGGAYSTAVASPIVVARPAVGSLPTTYDFRIVADGQTVPAHVEVVPIGFGPSLTVTATPGSSSYSIAYSYSGTLTLAIDGGSDGAAAASPIGVPRDSNNHTYRFKAVLDGQTITREVVIPALASAAGGAPSITGIYAYNADYPGDGGGGFDVSWVSNNLPGSGITYDIAGKVTVGNTSGGNTFTSTGNSGSPVHINTDLGPSAPSVQLTITAKQDGVVICTGVFPDSAVAL